MALPSNILQQVISYQMGGLAFWQNLNCFIGTANTKFKDFDKITANLGDTVGIELPPKFVTTNGLVASFQGTEQNVKNLQVDGAANVAVAYSDQQFIFNMREYMDRVGRGAIAELGAKVESDVAKVAQTSTYRFYGDGVTAINSSGQLASALAFARNRGMPAQNARGYLDDVAVADIVNSNLNQFVMKRNEDEAMSWELGYFNKCEWYQSNLLPLHEAGTEGVEASTLTVVSVVKNAAGGVTSIEFSGCNAAADASSVKEFDKFQFSDGVAGQSNMRFLTQEGQHISKSPVQFRATADATSTGASNVTVSIFPPLQAAAGQSQNINNEIAVGMQATVLPNHRCGLLTFGDPLYLAMPRLPNQTPFPTANEADPDTGASMRMYYGSLFGQNQQGLVHDCIWGKMLADDFALMLAFPE